MYTTDGSSIIERFPDSFLAAAPISIETLPMLHFSPGGTFLQVCTVGCNLTCPGCVSEVLVHHAESLGNSGNALRTDDIIKMALEEGCIGIAFALNDVIVSLPTFCRLAEAAHQNGLLIGCSTNGYMTEESAAALLPLIDFANIGLKGSSDERYRSCGAKSADPVFRTLRQFYQGGVHVEVSLVSMHGGEHEVIRAAEKIAAISRGIPLQVMRFIPFGDSDLGLEPTIYESEALCDRLRTMLSWVYLFNSPGSSYLTTHCPDCQNPCIEREFFGPMGSHRIGNAVKTCTCGYTVPIRGMISDEIFSEPGMMGGYRITRGLEMIWAILHCLQVNDPRTLAGIWAEVIQSGMLKKELHDKMNNIDAYYGLIMDLASRCNCSDQGLVLSSFIRDRYNNVLKMVGTAQKPRVYYAMGHPLFALNPNRFEGKLVEAAGGIYVNRAIEKEGKPGVTISVEKMMELNPEFIFTSGFISSSVSDTTRYCKDHNLDVPAVREGHLYSMHPSWDFGSPRWILGLMTIANILHPDRCQFAIEDEADLFYRTFYGVPYRSVSANRSFALPGVVCNSIDR